ncbi:hypothetical protein QYF61_023426, partial [Mycteria americana]
MDFPLDKRQWTQTETQAVLSEHMETLFYCEGDQALAQIVQTGCGVTIFGDTHSKAIWRYSKAVWICSWSAGSSFLDAECCSHLFIAFPWSSNGSSMKLIPSLKSAQLL